MHCSRLLQVSWHQLAHCLAASAKQSAASAEGAPADGADDALQSTMEMLLTELGAALVPITETAPAVSPAPTSCCTPSPSTSTSAGDPACCMEMASPTLFGDDHVAAIHSLRYAVEGLPLYAIGQRAWARVGESQASPFHPPMCALQPHTRCFFPLLLDVLTLIVQLWLWPRARRCCASARPCPAGLLLLSKKMFPPWANASTENYADNAA